MIIREPREYANLLWEEYKNNAFSSKCNNLLRMHFFNELERYHTGLFRFTNETSYLNHIQNEFFKYLWRYGELFITYINGRVLLWQVHTKWNKGVEVEDLTASLIRENINKYYQDNKIVKFKNKVNGVYLKWEPTIIPAILKYDDYINAQFNLYTIFNNATITDSKKFIYTTNNNSEEIAEQEIQALLDPTKPYVLNINPFAREIFEVQNNFTELNTGANSAQGAYDNLMNMRNLWKDILGVVVPTDNKKERKNLIESVSENYSSENIETIILRNLNNFAKEWNQLTGDSLSFEETTNLTENQLEETEQGENTND